MMIVEFSMFFVKKKSYISEIIKPITYGLRFLHDREGETSCPNRNHTVFRKKIREEKEPDK